MVELRRHEIRGTLDGPHLLITAGVHGDEFEGVAAIHQLMRKIVATEVRGCITLVPLVNESAFEQGNRCGADGLDLARTCPGNSTGSETQQVAAALVQLIQSADLYIDLHSGGVAMEIYPLVGYMLVQEDRVLETQRRMARVFGLPLIWGTSDNLEGRSLSAARDAQVPAIYAEYLGSGCCNPTGVKALTNGCLNVMTEFGMLDPLAERPQRNDFRSPVIQENRESGSGHMQLCYPARSTGLFRPSTRLGQYVQAGDTIGLLSDSFSGESDKILAIESGAVIVVRTYPRVNQGDSLAVVLENASELPPY